MIVIPLVYMWNHESTDTNGMTYNQHIIMDSLLITPVINYWSSISLNTTHQSYCAIRSCSVLHLVLECPKNFMFLNIWITVDMTLDKGVALHYILYSDIRPQFKTKVKSSKKFAVGQKTSFVCKVYTTIDTFRVTT